MKWLFLDPKQRLQRILANPGYAVKSVLREITWADERFLAQITGERVSRIRQFIDEPAHTPEFLRHVSECEKTLRTTRFESAETIVETGVANGVSSAHVLHASTRIVRVHYTPLRSATLHTCRRPANQDGLCRIGCGGAGNST